MRPEFSVRGRLPEFLCSLYSFNKANRLKESAPANYEKLPFFACLRPVLQDAKMQTAIPVKR